MENYKEKLEEQLQQLNELIKTSNKNVAKYRDLPDGHIHVSKSHGYAQYYFVDKEQGSRKYMGSDGEKLVRKYIQRDYENAMNRKLKTLRMRLQRFICTYDIADLTGMYEHLSEGRRRYVEPLIEPGEQLIEKWMEDNMGQKNPFPKDGIFKTYRGEMVRSKSEKIIADTLEKMKVPYQYEPMLELGYSTVYPDFAVLNKRTGQTLYWEHLGMVTDPEYAVKNLCKIQNYEINGYLLGKNLIITMESADAPINVKLIEQKINEFLI
ncbi:MAG: hypothetical protein K6D96_04690 [Acetatifactor sp.]|nr:hypothetical protein [Acetatifactor sp.]